MDRPFRVDSRPSSRYRLGMTPREAFLDELRTRTTEHLRALADESAETFGRFVALPELGPSIYHRLVEQFDMDGAQEIAATLIDLFSGRLDEGTVMVSDRAFRGLEATLDEFDRELPEGPRETLRELIRTLSRAGRN